MFHPTLSRTWFYAAVTSACLTGYPCAHATAISGSAKDTPAATSASATAPAKEKRVEADSASAPIDFPAIVERYGPAVVNIRATAQETAPAGAAPSPASGPESEAINGDDPILAIFKRSAQSQDGAGGSPRAMSGVGSGFIVSPNGLILTTAHVVDQSDDVTVRLTDRREFKGKVVAVDAQNDVAIIQIDATKLPTVKLGDSAHVRVGEQVLTIGSPDSYQNTVTAGIVSATSRTLSDGSTFPFFQTDVSLNPDNSGGPVFNRAGEVIGIDVQVYGDGDRAQSLTFAIPINTANQVRSRLQTQQGEDVNARSNLGIQVQDVDPSLAGAFGLPRAAGALVIAVEPGSPAAASNLKPGDVIVQLADKPIEKSADFVAQDAAMQGGTKVPVMLIRNHKQMTLTVHLGSSAQPASAVEVAGAGAAAGAGAGNAGPLDHLGLTMHPLTDDERRTTDLAEGLMVEGAWGAAANAGIKPGDVVLSLNGALVESQDELASLAAKAGKKAALLIQRDHARRFVTVDLK
ncbi:trypsin-like peptidase domain-containing protein [Paraburkholderia sp. HP33-1]|uniref:trypsin-like peptidase domain-containing protein n=1 Tax=Paraburkholderia sp. HP33-1 TaxID=2883243 RepID=UPI001F488448|nr:trypsin-like peptidase domain-containing protein [Paraburkholderia sp. HP33-1]